MKKKSTSFLLLFFLITSGLYAQLWKELPVPDGGTVKCFALNGNDIYAGTAGGLYVSHNNGDSWIQIKNGLPEYMIESMVITGNDFFIGTGRGVYRSRDNAATWELMENGIFPTGTAASLIHNGSIVVAGIISTTYVSTNDGDSWKTATVPVYNHIAAMMMDDKTVVGGMWNDGVCTSTDYGITWKQKSVGLPLPYCTINCLTKRNDTIFGGSNDGVFASADHCESWTKISTNLPANKRIMSLTSIDNILFAGTDEMGLYASTDGGKTWQACSTGMIPGVSVWSLQVKGSLLFAGTNQGVYISTNKGASWTASNKGIAALYVQKMELFGNNWFFGTSSNGAFYSPNNGVTWTQATNGISPNASVSCFVRFGTGVYTATKDGVHKSNDGGVSWTLLNTGLPIDTGVIKKGVHALGSRNLLLFAGTDNYGIYQSNDEGVTWVKSAGALTNVFVNTFISTSYYLYAATSQGVFYYDEQANDWKKTITDPTTIYVNSIAVTDKNLFAATTNGVFKSTDNGGVWVSASTGIPKDSYMHCIKTIKERVLTGMYNDLFLFDANNNKWISIHKELPFCPVTDIYTANTYLFACTGGKGVWYATTDAVIGISEYAKPAAFKVYPNPGSGIFKIAESGNSQLYSISRVEVVNATGACVYQLANPDLSSEIDLSKEARGVYVLRIISKEGAFENHKIVVE